MSDLEKNIKKIEKDLNDEKYVKVVEGNLGQIEKEEKKTKKGDGIAAKIFSVQQQRRMEQLAEDSASAIVARFNFLRTQYQLAEQFSREATEELETRITSLQERISQISEQIAVEEEESGRATSEISEISEAWASLQIALGKKVDLTSIDNVGHRLRSSQKKIALLFEDAKKNGKDREALILMSLVSIPGQPKQELVNLKKLYDEGKFAELSEIVEKAIVSAKERFKNNQERLSKLQKEKNQAETEIEEEHKKFNEKLSKIDGLKRQNFEQIKICMDLANKIPVQKLSQAMRENLKQEVQEAKAFILSIREQILRENLAKNRNNLNEEILAEAKDIRFQQQGDEIGSNGLPENYADLSEEKQQIARESREGFLQRLFKWLFGESLSQEELQEVVKNQLNQEIEERNQTRQEESVVEKPSNNETPDTERSKNKPTDRDMPETSGRVVSDCGITPSLYRGEGEIDNNLEELNKRFEKNQEEINRIRQEIEKKKLTLRSAQTILIRAGLYPRNIPGLESYMPAKATNSTTAPIAGKYTNYEAARKQKRSEEAGTFTSRMS